MDVSSATITLGSISFVVGIGLTVWNFIRNNKKDIQEKSTDYAVTKKTVDDNVKEISELKQNLKEAIRDWKSEHSKLENKLFQKVDSIDKKIDGYFQRLLGEK